MRFGLQRQHPKMMMVMMTTVMVMMTLMMVMPYYHPYHPQTSTARVHRLGESLEKQEYLR
jgi:predicted MFS family arabinose efflux permease